MSETSTVSAGRRAQSAERRAKLVGAARELFHRQSIETTTLAAIAEESGVPTGNVYYYFKTKDEIVAAVIDAHLEDIERMIAAVEERHRAPRARLKALIAELAAHDTAMAAYGCPMGSLCAALLKDPKRPDLEPQRLLALPLGWAEDQFRALGRRDAPELAMALIANYQGYALLTGTFHQPQLWSRSARRLQRWIDSVEAGTN